MELVYIWVEKYNLIERQSINFGSEYMFTYEEEKLSSRINNNYVQNFFSIKNPQAKNNKIINITGIVGENGVGKTTLLNLIIEILERKYEMIASELFNEINQLDIRYFAIIKNSDEYFLYNPFNIPVKIDTELIINKQNLKKTILNNRIIVSTVFSGKNFETEKSTLDLSTGFLVSNNIQQYKSKNIKWNLDLLKDQNTHPYIFSTVKIPEELNATLIKNYFKTTEFSVLDSKWNIEKRLVSLKNYNKTDKFKINLLLNVFEVLFEIEKLDKSFKNENDKYNEVIENFINLLLVKIKNTNNNFTDIGSIFDVTLNQLINTQNYISDNNYNIYEEAKLFINNMIQKVNEENIIVESEETLKIPLGNNYIQDFLEIYSILLTRYKDIFTFKWRGLSSGEEVILDLFSRIYYGLNSVKNNASNKTVTIVIDEIENNLHPQWQKEIIYELITFIENINLNQKIQLIISSHSPFILSDLPHSNVILLEKKDGRINKLNSLENYDRTFAGNIYSLYTNNFFIKDSLISKFAITKINNNYQHLLNAHKNEIIDNKESYKKLIDIIGEDLIRTKLKKMLEEKLEINIYDQLINSHNEINALRDELEFIKKNLKESGSKNND